MTHVPRLGRLLPWALVLVLLIPWGGPHSEDGHAHGAQPSTLVGRLLGPVGSLAASVQWVRFDSAQQRGRMERAYAHAAAALRLDPISPEGYLTLGRHLITLRGSFENEPDPARRVRWIRAGLDVLERGERSSNAPSELALARGVYLAFFVHGILTADSEIRAILGELAAAHGWFVSFLHESLPPRPGTLDWPGGSRAALEEARAAFERAASAGHPRAGALLAETWTLLADLED